MAHRLLLLLVFATALLSTGCGTLDNINRPGIAPPGNPDAKVVRLYGGTRSDFSTMLEYPWSQTPSPIDYVFIPTLAVFDLFLDLCGDTITLPYTAYEEIRRAFYRPDTPAGYLRLTEPPTQPLTPPPGSTPLPPPRPVETPAPTSPR